MWATCNRKKNWGGKLFLNIKRNILKNRANLYFATEDRMRHATLAPNNLTGIFISNGPHLMRPQ